MAVDILLKLGQIKGESVVKDHKDDIQLLSWGWAMHQPGSGHMGQGSGTGRVVIQDLTFTHYVDAASPDLIKSICTHEVHKEAMLVVRKHGKKALDYIKIKLEQVVVTDVTPGGHSGGDDLATESVTLNFRKFTYIYTAQESDTGAAGKSTVFSYDIPGVSEA